jgi:DNA adenine methylase
MIKDKYSPFQYQGSKFNMLNEIYSLIPAHKTFVEVFGGTGTVILNKKQVICNVYNDLNKYLFNLYKVIQDDKLNLILKDKIEKTFYGRDIFRDIAKYLRENREFEIPNLEVAYNYLVYGMVSFNGIISKMKFEDAFALFTFGEDYGKLPPAKFSNYSIILEYMISKFKNIIVENLDYAELIRRYDSIGTFFYLDPPYFKDKITRIQTNTYLHDFNTEQDHINLFEILSKIQGKAMVSYYDCPFIRELYKGWNFNAFNKVKSSSSNVKKDRTVELLILNYSPENMLF